MKTFKFVLILILVAFVGGILSLVVTNRIPKIVSEIMPHMMKMCEKMMSSGKFPMNCCKNMMEKHCK